MNEMFSFFINSDIFDTIMTYVLYFCDITMNVLILVGIHIAKKKIIKSQSTSFIVRLTKTIIKIFYYPSLIFFIIFLISDQHNLLLNYLEVDIIYYIIKVRQISFIGCLMLCIHNIVSVICQSKATNNEEIYALKIISMVVDGILSLIGLSIILSIYNVKLSTLFLTVCTPMTVLTYILKNEIEDFMNGLYLLLSNAYKIGDLIYVQDKGIEGYIDKIDLKKISILTQNNNTIFIRNSTFVNSLVFNKSKAGVIPRINMIININYNSFELINKFMQDIRLYMTTSCDFNIEKNFKILCKEVRSNSATINIIAIMAVTTINDEEYLNARQNLINNIMSLSCDECKITSLEDVKM